MPAPKWTSEDDVYTLDEVYTMIQNFAVSSDGGEANMFGKKHMQIY